MQSLPRAIALAAALFAAGAAQADEAGGWSDMFSLSGFGTLGAIKSDTDQATYRFPYNLHGGSAGDVDTTMDSRIGAQVTATVNDWLSGTVQVQSHETFIGNYEPQVEWAFVKAKFGDGFSVRLGRMGAPLFMVSDFRDVGYANLWVRPPLDVYGQVMFSHFDGADVLYQHSIGDATLNAQVLTGKLKVRYDESDLYVYGGKGFNASVEYGPFTFRAGYLEGKLHSTRGDLQYLDETLHNVSYMLGMPDIAKLGDDIAVDHTPASFTGVGIGWDWNDIVGSTEYTWRRIKGLPGDTAAWHFTGGYRLGKWTPYFTLSQIKQTHSADPSAIPDGLPGELAVLKPTVEYLVMPVSQKTQAIGLRWDAMRNVDIKAQIDHIQVPEGSAGMFSMPEAGFGGQSVNVYSLAVDFVF